jgi:putative nucleotidyltransferase with HDIG domain
VIKKISKHQLQLGMFIHDLNCRWMGHAFLRNRFMLRNEEDLLRIMDSSIEDVYIDTVKGVDAACWAPAKGDPAAPPEGAKENPDGGPISATPGGVSGSMRAAWAIRWEALEVTKSVLLEAKLGKQVQVRHLVPAVDKVIDSILQSPGALVCLCRIRHGDTYTFEHSISTCALLATFGLHLSLAPDVVRDLAIGGLLHDVGKMRVPDHVLNKPGKLSSREYEIMKQHVPLGLEILQDSPGITDAVLEIVGAHHERLDGSGYPKGKDAKGLSTFGRMAAIVDVYDALTAERVYKRASEPVDALTLLFEDSSSHFDPELVQHFIQAIGIYPAGTLVRLTSGRLAVVTSQTTTNALRPKVRVVYDVFRGKPISPLDIDLSGPEGVNDGIQQVEVPGKWRLNPYKVLMDTHV